MTGQGNGSDGQAHDLPRDETPTKPCPTQLLSDRPADEDSFGPHGRVANAIANLLRTEDGGKTIGLEGGWGSGKSTVVRLLSKQFEDSKTFCIILFDAWAHQGDPLRRTFLELAIGRLQQKKWINEEDWQKEIEELANRRKIDTSTTVPRLALGAYLFSVAALLIPFGGALFAAGLRETSPWNRLTIIGTALLAVPLSLIVIATLAVAIQTTWRLIRKKESEPDRPSGLLAFVINKAITEQQTTTTQSPEPTSVEFGERFRRLMNQALNKPDKRLLLVLDNLDRVSHSDALSMWATLQTFLQTSEHQRPSWFDRLWVLIPYDREAIRRLWNEPASQGAQPQPADEPQEPQRRKAQEAFQVLLAASYLDKSLQIRFLVPPLVLSSWQTYLNDCLADALPSHSPSEFHTVYRVAAAAGGWGAHGPTPRDLKLCVNGIGAIHRQWGDQVPLGLAAYYVLLNRAQTAVDQGLLDGSIPELRLTSALGTDVDATRRSLAALFFNVAPDLARQFLLSQPILDALAAQSSDELRALASVHREAFWLVLEQLLWQDDPWITAPKALAQAATRLCEAELLPASELQAQLFVTQKLVAAAQSQPFWTPFDPEMVQGILFLFSLSDNSQTFIEALSRSLANTPIGTDGESTPANTWSASFHQLIEGLSGAAPSAHLTPVRPLVKDESQWIDFCVTYQSVDPDLLHADLLRTSIAAAAIVQALSKIVTDGQFRLEHNAAVLMTQSTASGKPWNPLVEQATARLQAPVNPPPSETAALLACLWALSDTNESAQKELHAVATDGRLFHHLHAAFSQSDDTAIAWATRVIIRENAVASPPPAVENSTAGYDALKAFLSQPDTRTSVVSDFRSTTAFVGLLRSADELTNLLTVMDTAPWATPFVVDCLKILTKRPDSHILFSADIVLSRWKMLTHDVFMDDQTQWHSFLKSAVVTAVVAKRVMESDFTPGDVPLYKSLRAVLSGQDASEFTAWCVSGLKSQTSTVWMAAMQGGQPVLSLAFELLDKAADWTTEELASAVEQHAAASITTTPPPASTEPTELARLVNTLSPERTELLHRKLLDAAMEAHGKFSGPFFECYGAHIADPILLLNENRVVERLFLPILTERDAPGLKWLASVLNASPLLLRDHRDKSATKVFTERLQVEITKPDDEAGPSLNSMASTLGIELPPPPKEPNPDEQETTPEEPDRPA